jgi:hypothetical protein
MHEELVAVKNRFRLRAEDRHDEALQISLKGLTF